MPEEPIVEESEPITSEIISPGLCPVCQKEEIQTTEYLMLPNKEGVYTAVCKTCWTSYVPLTGT